MLGLAKILGGATVFSLAVLMADAGPGLGCQDTKKAKAKKPTSQAEVYRRIPKEPGVLINISRNLFPATRDVTLLGQRATPALRRGLLENTDAGVRWRAAQVLTQLRDPSARPDLHAALADWIPSVRHQALLALAVVGDRSSVPKLLERLADSDETQANRVAAIRALGRIGDRRAVTAVVRQLHLGLPIVRQLKKVHDEPEVRRAAVDALWDLRRVAPRGVLARQLHLALNDPDDRVVRRAAIISGNLKVTSALPHLRRVLLKRSVELRNVAAYAIGRLGAPGGIRVLEEALPRVRTGRLLNNISFALRRLRARGLWTHLRNLLLHKQAFIRLNAAFTAGEMRLPDSRPLLVKLLGDANEMVRAEALVALAKLRVAEAEAPLLAYAKQTRGAQRRLALRAALFVKPDEGTRTQYLKVTARTAHRRQAGLVMAELGDRRAAPLLFPSLVSSPDVLLWHRVKQLSDPLLSGLLEDQLDAAIRRGRLTLLPWLLDVASEDAVRARALPLVRLLYRSWPKLSDRRPSAPTALWGVLEALGESGLSPVKGWIEPYLQHASYWIRTEAQLALARLGDEPSRKQLTAALAESADHHRQQLVYRLGRLPLALVKQVVQPLLSVDDPYVKLAAGAALFYAGDARSAPLLAALRSPQAALRARARRYLSAVLDAKRHAVLQSVRKAEKDPTAQSELDRLLVGYEPRSPAFRQFLPREVVLY